MYASKKQTPKSDPQYADSQWQRITVVLFFIFVLLCPSVDLGKLRSGLSFKVWGFEVDFLGLLF